MAGRGIVVVLVMLARTASAEPSGLGIVWQAPASCPDAASVHRRIERRLGRPLGDSLVGEGAIDVAIARDHDRFVARVDLGAGSSTSDARTLTSASCIELADAVAVIVARVASEHAAHIAPKPVVAVAAAEDDAVRVAVHQPALPPSPRIWSIGVRLSGVSGIGVVPQVGLGAELALTARRRSLLAEIGETTWLTTSAQVHVGTDARVDVGLDVTAARVGWRSEVLPLRAWATAEVGSMQGSGQGGLANTATGSGRWFAAGAGFGVAWPMNRWSRLVGSTEVLGAFDRVRFSLGDGAVVYAPAPVSARATCGIEVGWQ